MRLPGIPGLYDISHGDHPALDVTLFFRRDDVEATRIGYRESNEAHQRTAERAQGIEQALRVAREAADGLKAEKSSLLGQVRLVRWMQDVSCAF